jgi:hypothetical protein
MSSPEARLARNSWQLRLLKTIGLWYADQESGGRQKYGSALPASSVKHNKPSLSSRVHRYPFKAPMVSDQGCEPLQFSPQGFKSAPVTVMSGCCLRLHGRWEHQGPKQLRKSAGVALTLLNEDRPSNVGNSVPTPLSLCCTGPYPMYARSRSFLCDTRIHMAERRSIWIYPYFFFPLLFFNSFFHVL